MFIDERERGGGGGAGGRDQDIDWFPLVCALTKNQTHNPSVYEMTLQPTEPHWPGHILSFIFLINEFKTMIYL